ncbi:PAS domain S-box protein [Sabulicella glaciei]|uniref:histidine kinase n=1 Tax=Sabulicella glaciei TaxID=2984948 RepID=A0ABT3NVA8_9PROT|nr:PAS domain S-box protein [Roseococcus sp. MDT2-1-1]MCW8086091.1 PAS domain S-box protein [Roseococcus sp. MDT2-1-1]
MEGSGPQPGHPPRDPSRWNEADRVAALERYRILDTPREPSFDEIASIAADLLGAPIAVVNFVSDTRQWFKAEVGIGQSELPLDVSICRQAILESDTLVVPDLAEDTRFRDNPLVAVAGGLRFYAGALLCTPEGLPIGTVCVLDTKPRPGGIPDSQMRTLRSLAAQVMAQLEASRALADLRESEAHFRLMADAVPQIVWVTDAQGRLEFFNRQWSSYTGTLEWPATAGDVAACYVHPEDVARTMAAFEQAKRTGSVFEVEHRIRRKDGAYRWFLVRAESYRDPATGRVIHWYGASTDIHDRKHAEERLRELNETLEAQVAERTAERDRMWATSPDLMLVIDFEGFLRRVNPAWTTVLGYAPEDLVGRYVNEFVLPDDHDKTVEAYELAAEGGTPRIVNRCRHKDGSTRWISWVAAPAGNMTYATGRDVTAERAREAELAAAEAARRKADALYRAYFENSPEALFVIGVQPDGGFVVEEINPAHEAAVGLRLSDIRGRRIEDILPESAARRVIETYRHVVATGMVHQYREEFDLDGDPQHWDTSLVPMRDPEGRIVRLIGSSRNVTRQVVAEEALRQSQKMEAMGQLTGGVAHDFNNLLTPIVGALDMLQRRGLGGEREQRLIAGAVQSADRARTLVQRLLAFARRQPLQTVAVDVAHLVAGMADLIASTTGPQIKVVVDAGRDLPPAKADPNQLEMAVLNLAVNARDAMPEGGTLRISVESETVGRQHRSGLKPGRYLHVSVADTGVGMDAATRVRAVEPFFSTKGVGKGTGLGLSMVHGLASQLGGALTIQSAPGLGTNVELWLPEGRASGVAGEPAVGEVAPASRRGTVLLVDDEDLVRLSTADMLIELGYKVVEAASAEEALRLLNRGLNPDVVVTDHLMPGVSGTDLARRLQAERPSIKVLVMSGYAETAGIAPDLPRLAKPFREAELAESLAALT